MPGVETLIFSTHGESMGRGAHPGQMRTRLHYVFSDESRRRFARHGIPIKHETSFQGGDGYLFFANRRLTTRALATIIMDGEDPAEGEDPFYEDTDLRLDFICGCAPTSSTCSRIPAIARCSAPSARTSCSRPARVR